MKKELYYSTVFQRKNILKEFLMGIFLSIASYPRLLLEVFLRKNMGERYFSGASVITIFFLLAALPVFKERIITLELIGNNLLYYLFLMAFLYMSFKRGQEISRLPSVFDFARYSLANGEVYPSLRKLRFADRDLDIRTIQTIIEPGIFFVAGAILIFMDQKLLGGVLAVSSVLFSLSYEAAYHFGEQMVMDEIDKIILSEDMVKAFVDEDDPSQTRGVHFFGRKPADKGMRQRVMNSMSRKKDDFAEVI